MFSMNFKGSTPTGCLHVWGRTRVGYIDISHGGILIPRCAPISTSTGNVKITSRYSKQWRRDLAVAQFDPGTYIECEVNLMQELRNTDMFEDSSSGLLVNATLLPETTYNDSFALGAIGTLVKGPTATSDNTALVYEPDPQQPQACLSQVKDPATCKQIAQQVLRQGNELFMRSYFNSDIRSTSPGINTGHAFLNTLNPANPTQCSFDPTQDPLDEAQQQNWWAVIGYDVDAKAQGFFHMVYDIANFKKLLGCDRPDPIAPTQVSVWTGDAKIYIGGSPYTESWEGELFEVIVDPQNSGPGADG